MYRNVRLWVVLMPMEKLTLLVDGNRATINSELVDVIEESIGERTLLLSAGLWWKPLKKYGKIDKVGALVMSDSGGFQFRSPTKGSYVNILENRKLFYLTQKTLGDWIVAGDVVGKSEMPMHQLKEYLRLTRDNMDLQFELMGDIKDRYINTLHGVSPGAMKVWYNGVKEYGGIGWAIGVKPMIEMGTALHFLFLYEQGELTPGKVLHMFGAGISKVIYVLMWLREQLGLDILLSFDNSSSSSFRFGSIWCEQGLVDYNDIRAGKVKVKLLDGRVLTDIGRRLAFEEYAPIVKTSLYWYGKHWLKFLDDFYNKPDEVHKLMDKLQITNIYKWFRFGGTEFVWAQISKLWKDRCTVTAGDSFRILKTGKVRKPKAKR